MKFKYFLLFTLVLMIAESLYPQCKITVNGLPCTGNDQAFSCNSNNGVAHFWKFDSVDSLNLGCSPVFGFTTPGEKRITLRVVDALGNSCLDTTVITIRSLTAHMNIDQIRPICETLIDLYDSSYIIQPAISEKDTIIKWSYAWYDHTGLYEKIFNDSVDEKFTAKFKHNGTYNIQLKTTTKLGCESSIDRLIYIPGPKVYFDTFVPFMLCTNEEIGFTNMSKYSLYDSCIWTWDFGDKKYERQFFDYTPYDTVWHAYTDSGFFNVSLSMSYLVPKDMKSIRCSEKFPDIEGLNLDPVKLIVSDCGSSSISDTHYNSGIKIFPNPANQLLQISGIDDSEVYLLNIYGKITAQFHQVSTAAIDISSVKEGLYLVVDKNFRVLGKVSIKR